MQSHDNYGDELNELSEKAESGDIEAGEKLLRLFVTLAEVPASEFEECDNKETQQAIRESWPEKAHPALIAHVARCMAAWAKSGFNEETARSAFLVGLKRGRPRVGTILADERINRLEEALRDYIMKRRDLTDEATGDEIRAAMESVCGARGLSEKTLRGYMKKDGNYVRMATMIELEERKTRKRRKGISKK